MEIGSITFFTDIYNRYEARYHSPQPNLIFLSKSNGSCHPTYSILLNGPQLLFSFASWNSSVLNSRVMLLALWVVVSGLHRYDFHLGDYLLLGYMLLILHQLSHKNHHDPYFDALGLARLNQFEWEAWGPSTIFRLRIHGRTNYILALKVWTL